MSITGRSQDFSTKPISWEALEYPVPIGSFVSGVASSCVKSPSRHLSDSGENTLNKLSIENGLSVNLDEETHNDKEQKGDKLIENIEKELNIPDDISVTNVADGEIRDEILATTDPMYINDQSYQEKEDNQYDLEHSLASLHTHRESTKDTDKTSGSVATYVSSQHKTDEFALIANEFSLYAQQSRGKRREQISEDANISLETEFTHPPPPYSQLSKAIEEGEDREKERVDKEDTMASVLTKESSANEHGRAKTGRETVRPRDRKQVHCNPKQTAHKTNNTPTTKTVQIAQPKPDQTARTNHRELIIGLGYENPSVRQSFDPRVRPVPVGGDRSEMENVTQRSAQSEQPSVSVRSPNGVRPSPRHIDNGLTQTLIMDLLSKGLGTFTKDMADLLVEQLKAEHEALANQVGLRVKDEAIEELSTLRKEVQELKEENASLKASVEALKIENVKEREQIKREFEKDRLKRVKDVEEKNERIAALENENESLKEKVKEKQKITKISEKKAKFFEDRRLKAEEEHTVKIKELQKELNKAKGDLLVFRSKKRVKSSTENERQKTRLISRGGASAGRRGTTIPPLPPTIPYQEGDP